MGIHYADWIEEPDNWGAQSASKRRRLRYHLIKRALLRRLRRDQGSHFDATNHKPQSPLDWGQEAIGNVDVAK